MTEKDESLSVAYAKAVALVSSNPSQAVADLTALQETIARAAIFSSNETLQDVGTNSIPLLALEHHLAMALTQVPTSTPRDMAQRQQNLQRAVDLWSTFYRTLERLERLSPTQAREFQILEDLGAADVGETARMAPPTTNRDAKIARFQAKKEAEQQQERLEAMVARRKRLGINENETLDGYDDELLQREIALKQIEICKQEAIDEWSGVIRELPMIARMAKQQEEMQGRDDRHHRNGQGADTRRRPDPQSMPPLQLTHITKDTSGQIQIRRDTARNEVFRRGWNQPTMTIEELAEREVADALAREERQKQAEAQQSEAPRRYDQLVKDGLEDRADLVDASAALDRKWDDWKDENPRGSGNKRGDVGDRNF